MACFWKKCMIILSLAATGGKALADEYGIIINKTNGMQDYVRFSESPKISFNQNDEIVFATLTCSITLRLDEVEYYKFGDVPENGQTSISSMDTTNGIDLMLNQNDIVIRNLKPDTSIKVYAVNGAEMITTKNIDSEATVDISRLNQGVYILTINDAHSFKFSKR